MLGHKRTKHCFVLTSITPHISLADDWSILRRVIDLDEIRHHKPKVEVFKG